MSLSLYCALEVNYLLQNEELETIQLWFDDLIANARKTSIAPAFEKPFTVIAILKVLTKCSEMEETVDFLRFINSKRHLVKSVFKSLKKEARDQKIKTPADFRTQFNEVLLEHIAVQKKIELALSSLMGSRKTLILANQLHDRLFQEACRLPSKQLIELANVYLEEGQSKVNVDALQLFQDTWMNESPEEQRESFYTQILSERALTFQIGVYGLLRAKYSTSAYSFGKPTQADRSIDREDVVIKNEDDKVTKLVAITKAPLKHYLEAKREKYKGIFSPLMLITPQKNIPKVFNHEKENLEIEILSAEELLNDITKMKKLDVALTCFFLEFGRRMQSTRFLGIYFDPFH